MLIDADDWHCRRQNPRYLPSGDYRTAPTQTFTDRGYTGHLHDDGLGLVYMNARYFIPSIGRFASADTIVPQPGNPQDFNRYSYVQNNPIKFFDPSGWCSGDPSDPNNPDADCWTLLHRLEQQYHISLTGDWLFKELLSVLLALIDIEAGLDGIDHFAGIFGGTTLHRAQGILNGPDGVTARAIWASLFMIPHSLGALPLRTG